jgi:predicted DNA-binding ribbon-helix-helix protein
MCKVYLSSDPIQYEARSRTLRIHGVATTIRLENEFWGVLQNIAKSEGKTTNQIITELYDEAVMNSPDETPRNFASVLRVSCCRYLEINATPRLEARPGAAPLELVGRR